MEQLYVAVTSAKAVRHKNGYIYFLSEQPKGIKATLKRLWAILRSYFH
jgi:hypothetical protein